MEVLNNKKLYRFEILCEGGKIAFLEYRWKKGDMLLMRTYVPVEHRRQKAGATLARTAMEYARDNNLKVQVFCPFAELFIKKHEEYKGLLSSEK